MNKKPTVRIRHASSDDLEFILSLIPRLVEFGPPPWRNIPEMLKTDIEVLTDKLLNQPSDTVFFIAEDAKGNPLGFIHLQAGVDYYNHEKHAHIANIIVASAGQGQGIGRLLMEKGEEWARAQGYRWLTLSVFSQNQRAREVYEGLGYGADIMKYVKELT